MVDDVGLFSNGWKSTYFIVACSIVISKRSREKRLKILNFLIYRGNNENRKRTKQYLTNNEQSRELVMQ